MIELAALAMTSETSHAWNGETIRSSRLSTTIMEVSSGSSLSTIGRRNRGRRIS